MLMLEYTSPTGKRIGINPQHVVAVYEEMETDPMSSDVYTMIYSVGDSPGEGSSVKEPYDKVLADLKMADPTKPSLPGRGVPG